MYDSVRIKIIFFFAFQSKNLNEITFMCIFVNALIKIDTFLKNLTSRLHFLKEVYDE